MRRKFNQMMLNYLYEHGEEHILKEYAKQYGMSVNALIRCAVIEYMNKKKLKGKS